MSSNKEFYVYSKNGCGFCEKLIDFMSKKGITYQKFLLGQDFTSEDFVDKFGTGTTFPQVIAGYEQIGGMKDTVRYLVDHKYV